MDCLDRLRHYAVICCHDQYHQIGNLGAARTHGRKGFMAWRIEKSDHPSFGFHMISADMLRDATRFATCHTCTAYVIQ